MKRILSSLQVRMLMPVIAMVLFVVVGLTMIFSETYT